MEKKSKLIFALYVEIKLMNNVDKKIKFFTERVLIYQKYFGLLSYEIDILPQIKNGTNASTLFNDGDLGKASRRVTIAYSLGFINDEKTTLDEIDKSAFHEICELFLGKIRFFAEYGISPVLVDNEIHSIIRTLENTLFLEIKNK